MKILNYEINPNDEFIGIGHRAQQGKDTVANYIKEYRENVHLIYWVDDLVTELKNPLPSHHLIQQLMLGYDIHYEIADSICENHPDRYIYRIYHNTEFPKLHQIFEKRGLVKYMGMEEKDPEMMQFWGVDYRRNQDNNYWIKKTLQKIEKIQKENNQKKIFVFHNTRFKNEYDILNLMSGKYLKIERKNSDGTYFIDGNRDPNHISEVELKNVEPDFYIEAQSGDLDYIKDKTKTFLEKFNI